MKLFTKNILFKRKNAFSKYADQYCKQIEKLRKAKKIRVCFSVVYDSVFPAECVFNEMLKDDYFEPFILVIPDAVRGDENMFYQMNKTYKSLSKKYKNVFMAYDKASDKFIDWHTKIDICIFANPYDGMTKDIYTVEYLSKYALCVHIPYGYSGCLSYNKRLYKSDEYSKFWRIYVENNQTYKLIKKYKKSPINNLFVSGYPKMDMLKQYKRQNKQIQIMITSHHTITPWRKGLNISQFLRFADYYLTLPKKYPDIKFIFRPHPLLFVKLEQNDMWGKTKSKQYIEKITSFKNVEYQEGGDYFQSFIDSDGIINDCGSFLVESFYFPMPQCFLLKNKKEKRIEFTSYGRKILKHVYRAYKEKDIDNFICSVVLNKCDPLKQARLKLAHKELMVNYPCATDAIITDIKNMLKGAQ